MNQKGPQAESEYAKSLAYRQTVIEALRERARRMHTEAVGLEALAASCASLPPEAEEALWRLLC